MLNRDKLNMRDEIIVAGDESDAKRQPSREPQPSSPPVDCLDGTTIAPTEPAEVSDQQTKPPDGEDTCKMVPVVATVADADRWA